MKLGYRPALDGVRALAIVPVVTLHAFGWPRNGSVGVDLFFVLSGFLITTLLLEERAATGTIAFRAFYRRRAARLVPALLFMLLVYLVASRGAHAWAVVFGATYTANIATVIDPGTMPWSLGHLWSLAQEEQFYLWWPPLLLLVAWKRPQLLGRIVALLILFVVVEKVALLASGAGENRLYFAPDTHADPLLIGCLFGILFATGRAPVLGRFGLVTLGALLAMIAATQWLPLLSPVSPVRTLFAFGCGFLILAATESGPIARLLSLRPFVFLGQISYSLYLWHVPILVAAGAAAYDHRPGTAAIAAGAAVVVASGSYFLVERPLRARLRRRNERLPGPLTLQET